MSSEVVDAALTLFLSRCRQQASIIFLGGEPMLHPRLGDLVRRVRERTTAAGVQCFVSVSTNGGGHPEFPTGCADHEG
jgi:hypothetical protein